MEVLISGTEPHTITATAVGYQEWTVTFNPHIQHHKRVEIPIEMKKTPDQASTGKCGQLGSECTAPLSKRHPSDLSGQRGPSSTLPRCTSGGRALRGQALEGCR